MLLQIYTVRLNAFLFKSRGKISISGRRESHSENARLLNLFR